MHLAVDAHGMPVRFFVTSSATADCQLAELLIEAFRAEYLLADRSYDTDAFIRAAQKAEITPDAANFICGVLQDPAIAHLVEFLRFAFSKSHLIQSSTLQFSTMPMEPAAHSKYSGDKPQASHFRLNCLARTWVAPDTQNGSRTA